MSAPFDYQIVFDATTCDVGKFTADIHTALDEVEHYNWSIKVCEAKWRQAIQIAANLDADPYNPTRVRANHDVQDIDQERSKLETARQIVLRSVDQAIRCLEQQLEIANNMAIQFEGVNHELHQDALIAIAKWKADIAHLQARRDAAGHTPGLLGFSQEQSSSSDNISD